MSNIVSQPPRIDYSAPWPKALAPVVNNNDSIITQIFMAAVYIPSSIASWVKGKLQTLTGYLICPTTLGMPESFEVIESGRLLKFTPEDRRADLKNNHGGEELNLESPNGDIINAMHFPGKVKKAIVYATGNGAFYENASSFAVLNMRKAIGEDINLMVLNPPDVGKSRAIGPLTEEGFALSVYSACKYLIDTQGIDPNDIVIWGFSLGGGYGAKAAALLQENYPKNKINAFIQNSFSSLPKVMDWLVSHEMFPIFCIGYLLGKIASVIAWALSYNFDSLENLRTLKGKVAIAYNNSDAIMGEACLKKSIKETNSTAEKPLTGMQIKLVEKRDIKGDLVLNTYAHNRPLYAIEQYEVIQQIRDMLGFSSAAPLNPKIRRSIRTAPKQAIADTTTAHLNQIKSHLSILDRFLALLRDETLDEFERRDYVEGYMRTFDELNYTFRSEDKTLCARFKELSRLYREKGFEHGIQDMSQYLQMLRWTLDRLKVELALCYFAASDLKDLKEVFASLEKADFAPADKIPSLPANYAEAFFKCLEDVYEAKRTQNTPLPPAKGDFGRKAFLHPEFNQLLKREAIAKFRSLIESV